VDSCSCHRSGCATASLVVPRLDLPIETAHDGGCTRFPLRASVKVGISARRGTFAYATLGGGGTGLVVAALSLSLLSLWTTRPPIRSGLDGTATFGLTLPPFRYVGLHRGVGPLFLGTLGANESGGRIARQCHGDADQCVASGDTGRVNVRAPDHNATCLRGASWLPSILNRA
jgi:hypothetical protein